MVSQAPWLGTDWGWLHLLSPAKVPFPLILIFERSSLSLLALSTELEKAENEALAMRKQSEGLTKEYDRLLEEHTKLQVSTPPAPALLERDPAPPPERAQSWLPILSASGRTCPWERPRQRAGCLLSPPVPLFPLAAESGASLGPTAGTLS